MTDPQAFDGALVDARVVGHARPDGQPWPSVLCNDYAEDHWNDLETFGWETLVPFEVFDKRMTPLAKAPSVTIQKRGVISLNKAAHDLMGGAETVEMLYDQDRQVMALRPADDSSPHAYAVRTGSKRGPGQAIVSATAFTQHYGIDTTATRRWKPFVEDGMLCVDLTQEGVVITGNRTKALSASSAGEGLDVSTADSPSAPPTQDNADRP